MVNTEVTLSGVKLSNPVIPASGTFGYGYEFSEPSSEAAFLKVSYYGLTPFAKRKGAAI